MVKIKKILITLLALVILIMVSSSVFATTVNKVTYENSKITVSGTCTTGNQVQIAIFDANKQPIYFATVKVENNSFNEVLPASFSFKEGEKYTVKIADYSGASVSTETFVAENVNSNEKDDTPKTGLWL